MEEHTDPSPLDPENPARRHFMTQLAALGGALALGMPVKNGHSAASLPDPQASGIDHFVVVTMENRSFDHFLGWLPGADGQQAGLSFLDQQGRAHETYPLAPDYQGCAYEDPDHSYAGGRRQYANGACDGWLQTQDDLFPIGYYTQADLPFFAGAAPAWTVCDRYFCSILGPTYPNRFYLHAAQTDRLDDATTISKLPTIWDRLNQAGLRGRYYYGDTPFLALWGRKYLSISRPMPNFFLDAASRRLPHVAYLDPRFLGEDKGLSNDDHPHADIRAGQAFLNRVYEAVTRSPAWNKTMLIITYDEWGGFYDHVAPPLMPVPPADQALGNDGRLGFRVPTLLVSPRARRNHVSSTVYEHASILRTIAWRWNLEPLTVRDATANNLAAELDFETPLSLAAPHFKVPNGPFASPCLNINQQERPAFLALRNLSIQNGFALPD